MRHRPPTLGSWPRAHQAGQSIQLARLVRGDLETLKAASAACHLLNTKKVFAAEVVRLERILARLEGRSG